jgi:hypothetical protein
MSVLAVDDAFIEAAEGSRVKILTALRDALGRAEKKDVEREEFHQLFLTAVRVLELDQDTTARIVKSSRPTVSRWMSGHNIPHRVGRASVFTELRKVASDKLKQHSLSLV